MKHSQIHERVSTAAEASAAEYGYELVEIEITKKPPRRVIATVFHKDGTNIDVCADISRSLSKKLDEESLFEGSYTLEVQSPGLDRPIRTVDDYRRNLGNKVEVHLYKKVNNQKEYVGILTDYDDDTVDIRDEDGDIVTFDSKSISLMRQVIEF